MRVRRAASRAALPSPAHVATSAGDFRHRSQQAPPGPSPGRRGSYGGRRLSQVRFEKARAMAKTSPGEFLRQIRAEGAKVVWPTREETTRTAIFVAIMMVILAA